MMAMHSIRSKLTLLREYATIFSGFTIASLRLIILCLPLSTLGQAPPAGAPALANPFGTVGLPGGAPTFSSQHSVVIVTVRGENGALLDRQAVVKLYNKN